MNWLLARLARVLIGNGLTNVTDDLMDGLTLAIEEEFALLGMNDREYQARVRLGLIE